MLFSFASETDEYNKKQGIFYLKTDFYGTLNKIENIQLLSDDLY